MKGTSGEAKRHGVAGTCQAERKTSRYVHDIELLREGSGVHGRLQHCINLEPLFNDVPTSCGPSSSVKHVRHDHRTSP